MAPEPQFGYPWCIAYCSQWKAIWGISINEECNKCDLNNLKFLIKLWENTEKSKLGDLHNRDSNSGCYTRATASPIPETSSNFWLISRFSYAYFIMNLSLNIKSVRLKQCLLYNVFYTMILKILETSIAKNLLNPSGKSDVLIYLFNYFELKSLASCRIAINMKYPHVWFGKERQKNESFITAVPIINISQSQLLFSVHGPAAQFSDINISTCPLLN